MPDPRTDPPPLTRLRRTAALVAALLALAATEPAAIETREAA